MKDHQQQQEKQSRECQPFDNFVAAKADKFSDAQYDNFQADVLNLLRKFKRVQSQSQVANQLDDLHNISGFVKTPNFSAQPQQQITPQTLYRSLYSLPSRHSSSSPDGATTAAAAAVYPDVTVVPVPAATTVMQCHAHGFY